MVNQRALKGKNLAGLLVAVLISLGVILCSMRIWEMDLNVPPGFTNDYALGAMLTKSIKQNGIMGLWRCETIGAPELSALADTPFLDLNYGLTMFAITRLVPNGNVACYVMYILGYALAALFMYLLLNRFTDRVLIKSFFSVAFAITPYHFLRGLEHLTLSHYFSAPVAVYLMLVIYGEDFSGVAPERYLRAKWKIAVLYASALLLGLSNIYYAFFGLMGMSLALIGKLVRQKKLSCLIREALPIYAALAGVVIGLVPKLYYSWRHGFNAGAVVRPLVSVEIFALKIVQLLLPSSNNRIGFLADLNRQYSQNATNVNENACATLGLIATVGFIIACAWLIGRLFRRDERKGALDDRMSIISLSILTILLYSMPGGFGTFVNYFVTQELRCLNRASIYIVCLSLCTCCLFSDYLAERLKSAGQRRLGAAALLLAGAFALYSEVPVNPSGLQDWAKAEDRVFRAFFAEMEAALPEDSMIYQLPFMTFPENGPVNGMADYEPALGYVYTDHLRWSYGGMKGRNDAAQALYIDEGMSRRFVKHIVEAGFAGVYIDVKGYADNGEAVIAFYSDELGLTPLATADGWLYFYNLSDVDVAAWDADAGAHFVSAFAARCGVDADVEKVDALAAGLVNRDEDTLDELWAWALKLGADDAETMDNRDFVLFLYNDLIGRDEPNPEHWAGQIDDGSLTRRQAFGIFLTCDEFRMTRGID
ncbi:MAG: hypothetical protein IJ124_01800 [Clostridia bacterium]|nr:hypothetical protein [Clostridia bacterium]